MFEYSFTRTIRPDNLYDIDNPDRVDVGGEQIHLSKEIETIFSGKHFTIINNATSCKVIFDLELTPVEVTQLNAIVSAHKSNA